MAPPRKTIDELPEQGVYEAGNYLIVQDSGVTKKMAASLIVDQVGTPLQAHLDDATDAHDASAISATASGVGVDGPNVQAQLGQIVGLLAPFNEVQVGTDEPTDAAIELWYDSDEPGGVDATVSYASNAETIAGTVNDKSVTPAGLAYERPYLDVRSYGAVGDGVANDAPAIQAAIDAASAEGGGIVWFPTGNYLLNTTVTLKGGVHLRGASNEYMNTTTTTRILSTVADLFAITANTYSVIIEGLYLRAAPGAGHIFNLNGFAAGFWDIRHCTLQQDNNAKSVMRTADAGGGGGNVIEMHVHRCWSVHTATATVPTWHMQSAVNAINVCQWTSCRFENAGDYHIHIESTGAGYCQDDLIADCNFERCLGGEVRLLSCRDVTIERCSGYDGTTYTKDRYYIGKSTAGSTSAAIALRQVVRRSPGVMTAGKFDILVVSGQAARCIIEQCNGAIDLGATNGNTIIGYEPTSPAAVYSNVYENSIQLTEGQFIGRNAVLTGTAGFGYIDFLEQSADPAAGAANHARLFCKDNGAGKTQLVVRFPTGATQVIATEP